MDNRRFVKYISYHNRYQEKFRITLKVDIMKSLNRRDFLKTSGGALSTLSVGCQAGTTPTAKTPPNILVIMTDQQSATMMGCAGNSYVNTPSMDRLAASGVRFDRAYCTAPVCVPSRFSMMTGRMPSEIAMRNNEVAHIDKIPDHILQQGMGHLFRRAGYDAAFGGKEHLPKMDVKDLGFDYICRDERDELATTCAEYISQRRDRPFLLFASFINPHDICYMAIRDFASTDHARQLINNGVVEVETLDRSLQLPEGVSREEFFKSHCPPLPANFEPQQDEPEAIRDMLAMRPFRKNARDKWSDERWRLHRWAYHRLTDMVDVQIGRVMDALRESGKERDTLVIFTSDHGDMDSSHRMEHKTTFYDEACRVPLIVSRPGMIPSGVTDSDNLMSTGLDLYPTLCDAAGIEMPDDLQGVSMLPVAEGKSPDTERDFVRVENEIGRMIVTRDYKYMLHDEGENREQLIDLLNDPGEMRNAIDDSDLKFNRDNHRKLFESAFGSSG